jgi:pimeloyl-ACP methyl ester carboxylesterase
MLGFVQRTVLGRESANRGWEAEAIVIGSLEPGATPAAVPDASRPILLLQGFGSSSRALGPLGCRLERSLGRKVVTVCSRGRCRDLRERARQVDRVLSQLAAAPGFRYADVVGYSMGGLVATCLLKCIDGGSRVRNVVTLGAPHRGEPGGFVISVASAGSRRVADPAMSRSRFVEEVKWMPVPSGCRLVSIAGERDRVVPPSCSRLTPLPGHRNMHLPGVGHRQLASSRSVLWAVYAALACDSESVELEALAA